MDNKSSPSKEAADELTRESLIAISYLEPDTAGKTNVQPQSFNKANGDAMTNDDDTEKYRSELMSISDLPTNDDDTEKYRSEPISELPPPKASPVAMDP